MEGLWFAGIRLSGRLKKTPGEPGVFYFIGQADQPPNFSFSPIFGVLSLLRLALAIS